MILRWKKPRGLGLVGSIREYVTLVRPYGILFLGFTPVFGAVCNGEFRAFHLSVLLMIGLFTHVFAFVQNDYYDVEVDRRSTYVASRPLTTGTISKNHAFLVFVGSFLLSLVFAVVFVFSWASFLFLLLSFFLMTLYNKYSKRVLGMECVLGAGVFVFGVFGALTVSDTVSPLSLIISFVGFFQWMFSVGVLANLKDVEFDAKLGIRTTPIMFGVRVRGHELKKPVAFIVHVYVMQFLFIMVAALPFLFGYTLVSVLGVPIPLLCFLVLSVVLLYITYRILSAPLQKRDTLLRYGGVHEGLALVLIPIVLTSFLIEHLGILSTLGIIFLMLFWPLCCLRLLYGKTMIPLE